MVRCPIGSALPLTFFHSITGNYVDPDAIDVEFQVGMLRITIGCLGIDSLPNRRKNPLSPLVPRHAGRKAGKDVQIGLITQPSVPREGSLDRGVASKARIVQGALKLAFQSLSQLRHSFPFGLAW